MNPREAAYLRDRMKPRGRAGLTARGAFFQPRCSQIGRVRETLRQILHNDSTLAEWIKTFLRDQGITVVFILAAIGMTISTLVLALPGGAARAHSDAPAQPTKSGVLEWVKKLLKALGAVLAKLAERAAAAIAGVIGSVLSMIAWTAVKAVGWLAIYPWALFQAIGGLLLVAASE